MTTWANPPVDDVGYIASTEMLAWTDDYLRGMISNMRIARYTGWRNHEGVWRDVMGLDTTRNSVILDYGCGVGMEALEFDESNFVMVADIEPANVELALRVAEVHGQRSRFMGRDGHLPLQLPDGIIDAVHCSGVLHHISEPRPVVEEFHRILAPGGELRLMLYSDIGWQFVTRTDPPEDVRTDPDFESFVRFYDSVGDFAEWYNADKLAARFGDLFEVERCDYMTPDRIFLGAVLRRIG